MTMAVIMSSKSRNSFCLAQDKVSVGLRRLSSVLPFISPYSTAAYAAIAGARRGIQIARHAILVSDLMGEVATVKGHVPRIARIEAVRQLQ
jgi:hypothetical protein